MTRLEFEGVIEGRQGKGTFVSRPKLVHRDRLLRSLEKEIQAQGCPARVAVAGDEAVHLLRRLKLVDSMPLAIEMRFFPSRIGEVLEHGDLGRLPVYELIESVIGRFPKRLVELISCSGATEEESGHLRVAVGHPLLIDDHTMFDDDGTPLVCGKTIFRGDRCQVYVESWRNR